MDIKSDEFLWVEKYRPQTIQDAILLKHLESTFLQFVENEEVPNLLLCGSAGVGKTTVAKALCEQMGYDWIILNGSSEGDIDIRTKIVNFASTVSFSGKGKVVIYDEADYLTAVTQLLCVTSSKSLVRTVVSSSLVTTRIKSYLHCIVDVQ